MKRASAAGGDDFVWLQPRALEAEYELRQGRKVVATLRFAKAAGSLATGEAGGHQWTFKRVGFLRPRVTVRVPYTERDVAIFEPGWSGAGRLSFADGRAYRWTKVSAWRQEWAFLREDGSFVIGFRLRWSRGPRATVRIGATVRTGDGAEDLSDLPVLQLLGWYLQILMDREADTAAAAATIGMTTG